MKLIGNICFIAFVIWVASFFFKSEAKELPSNEVLISQFEMQGVLKRDEWKKGNVVDGVQVYSARTEDNIIKSSWLLGVKQAGVVSIAAIQDPSFSGVAALSSCYKLVKSVLSRDDKQDFERVERAFKYALSAEPINNTQHDTEIINGFRFEIQMGTIGSNLYSYACTMKPK